MWNPGGFHGCLGPDTSEPRDLRHCPWLLWEQLGECAGVDAATPGWNPKWTWSNVAGKFSKYRVYWENLGTSDDHIYPQVSSNTVLMRKSTWRMGCNGKIIEPNGWFFSCTWRFIAGKSLFFLGVTFWNDSWPRVRWTLVFSISLSGTYVRSVFLDDKSRLPVTPSR